MENLVKNQSNNLKYNKTIVNKNGENLVIKIRLNDECKNGHQYFSITADLYTGSGRSDRNIISCGCLHDEILKSAPQFKMFVDLHLCDYDGVPTYAVANGFYHMTKGFDRLEGKTQKQYFCDYYRVSTAQYDILMTAKEQDYFGFLLVELGILSQWKKEAKKAIKELELLTGVSFVNDSVKSQFNMSSEKLFEVEQLHKEGFYTIEKMNEREAKKQADKKASLLSDLKNRFDKKHLEAIQDYEIDKIAIGLFNDCSNIIFYTSQNNIVVNWQNGTYNRQYSESEFKAFTGMAKKNKYLKDCTFELKTK
jgi:hypothetical protein